MNRLSRLRRLSACVSLLSVSVVSESPAAAQDFFEIVDVPVVNVDVVVTDRRDRPIPDLVLEDFTLFVDGQEQEIAFFSAPVSMDSLPQEKSDPVYLVILFDNNGIGTQARNGVIEQIQELIEQGDSTHLRMLVASAGLSGLEIHQEFTPDADLVHEALSGVAGTVARDRHVADYEELMLDIQRLAGVRDPTQTQLRMQALTLTSQIQAFSDRARQEAEITGGHLWQLVEALSGLQGRKAILFVGGAMSISPGEALFSALRESLSRTADVGAQKAAAELPAGISTGGNEAVEALSNAASVHQVALYSIVVGGASRTASIGGSAGSLDTEDSSSANPSASSSPGIEFRSRQEVETALQVLAAATGGFVHSGDRRIPGAWKRLESELSSTYSLGFHPLGGTDEQLHRIQVEVAGRRLRVRHRESFRVQGWDQETLARLRSSLHFGAMENPLAVGLEAGPAEPSAEGEQRVPLTLRTPLSSMALEPVELSHRGQMSVFMIAGGKRFQSAPARKAVLPVIIPNDELLGLVGQVGEYRLDLEVPEGTSQIAVGIRDDLNTQFSILSIDLSSESTDGVTAVEVAEPDGGVPASDVATLRLPTAALVVSGQNGGAIGLTLGATLERASEDLWRVPVEIQIESPSDGDLEALDLFVYALAADGRTAAKDARVVTPRDQVKTVVPLELAIGRYAIRVAARDRGSSAFGVMGMDIEISGSETGQIRWSSIAPADDLPGEAWLPGPEEIGNGDLELSRGNVLDGYLQVLEVLSKGDEVAARDALRAMEIGLAGDRAPKELADMAKMEARVLKGLADGNWNRLLPLAVLYGEMIDDYRRLRQAPLSEHAVLLSVGLAEQMARSASSAEAKREAADLLTSMSGYLLYSQRLTKTGELLSLAVKEDPHNLSALMALAATREQKGDYEGALKVLNDLLEVVPDSDEGRLRLGVNLARVGKSRAAAESFRRLGEADTEEWVAQVASQELARALVDLGETAEAVDILEFAAARWPEQPSMRVQLAWLLDQVQEPEQAGVWVNRLIGDSSRATNPPRYRYIQWYEKGLEDLRRSLVELSIRRAGDLSRTPGSAPQEAEGR